jgi:23S rRNA (uracil1939-C5)-methyltransferase
LTDETVTIDRGGAEGDGIATAADGATLYVPDVLPGELVQVGRTRRQGNGWLAPYTALLQASDARVAPPCTHFGTCGGCVLQHWRDDAYAAWKCDLLRDALRRAGFADPSIAPLARTAVGQRRHMDLAAQRTAQGVHVGLHRRSAASVIDLDECAILHPALFALLTPLRALLSRLRALRRDASIVANLLDHGADLLLRTDAVLDRGDREPLIAFARTHRLVRLAWATAKGEPEPVVILQPPRITLSGVAVELPPGAFLQASVEGETAIVRAVLAGLPDGLPPRARVAELYAGCGTLTFALAQHVRVAAWEGDAGAAAAARAAANRSGLAGRVTVTQRDLARQPVTAAELSGYAAVVLDPPFAGAAAQTAQIAAAKPPRVIYVSCNPAVLARDARMLHDAGYTLLTATPIDQFLWSARLESVCVFGR